MKRVLSVWFPHWQMQRLRRRAVRSAGVRSGTKTAALACAVPDDVAFALVATQRQKVVVTALNRAGHEAGLSPGIALADARAQVPSLVCEEAVSEAEAADLTMLAHWCGRYGAGANVEGSDGLWIDISGVAHLYGGEAALLHDLRCRLKRAGFTVRLGLGDTHAAAWAVARFGIGVVEACRGGGFRTEDDGDADADADDIGKIGTVIDGADYRHCLLPVGQPVPMVSSLPVAALNLDERCSLLLRRLGLKTIGQLMAVPRVSLKRRFPSRDSAHAVLARLDLVLGRSCDALKPLRTPSRFAARLAFPEPLISTEPIENAVTGLCDDLVGQLDRACAGARRVSLVFYRSDGSTLCVAGGFGRPCNDARHMMRVLREKLDTIDAGFGIDLITLDAVMTDKAPALQGALDGDLVDAADATRSAPAQDLIDRLVNRIGAAQVYQIRPRDSHVPERSQRRVPPFDPQAQAWTKDDALAADQRVGDDRTIPVHAVSVPRGLNADPAWLDRQRVWNPSVRRARAARPAFLLARAERIAVLAQVPEGAPSRFIWRHRTLHVAEAQGPERIAHEWWCALGLPAPSDMVADGAPADSAPGPAVCDSARSPGGAQGSLALAVSTEAPVQRKLRDGDDRGQRDVDLLDALLPEADPLEPLSGDLDAGGVSTVVRRAVRAQRPRDYYRVTVREGGAFWLYREGLYQAQHEEGAPDWYLHGVFY